MTRFTITPWRTQADLIKVRQQLYPSTSPDVDSRRHAVDRIMAWKLRGNLPHAVESTALLIDAILHHDINTNSIFSIRAVYSAAFCRFVTGFCDIGRHKERSLEPSSMLDIAKQIDMPPEFVALRHEATHEELPSTQRLVSATRQALDWLYSVYWSRLTEPNDGAVDDAMLSEFKTAIATELRNFRRLQRQSLRSNAHDPKDLVPVIQTTRDATAKACQGRKWRVEALSRVLVEQRLLIPANREMGVPLDGAFLIWDELLQELSTRLDGFGRSLGGSLCEGLAKLSTLEAQHDVNKDAHAKWLLHLLTSDFAFQEERATMLAETMRWCCLYPGLWAQKVGQDLLEIADDEFRVEWSDLFNAASISGESLQASSHAFRDPPTRSDVELAAKPARGDREEVDLGQEHVKSWQRVMLAPSVPIGVVS